VNGQPIRPGTWLYWLAGVMAAAAVALLVVGIVGFAGKITGIGKGLQQVVAPGTAALTLDKPGTYTIYHEHQSAVGGRTYSNPQGLSDLTVTVVSKATGQSANLRGASMSETYTFGSRQGVAVWQFDIDAAGEYDLSAVYAAEAGGPEVVLAVGPPVLGGIKGMILGLGGGICGFVVLGAGALAIFIVTILKRGSAKRRLGQPPAAA